MKKEYKTIKEYSCDEFIEKKSRFIGSIIPCKTEKEALEFIEKKKKEYWDATHNVYAYIIKDEKIQRCSDDGEPSGTAGRPVLDVLEKENLTDICVIATRYFGGTMLGAGGLVRAYSHTSKIAVNSATVVKMCVGNQVKIHTDYNTVGKVLYELGQRGLVQDDSEYTDVISITVTLPIEDLHGFEKKITEISSGKSIVEVVDEVYFEVEV